MCLLQQSYELILLRLKLTAVTYHLFADAFDALQCDERCVSGYATIVILLSHQYVAVVTPVGRPRVLHQPVRLSIKLSIPNRKHCMIQIVWCISCFEETIFVQLKSEISNVVLKIWEF